LWDLADRNIPRAKAKVVTSSVTTNFESTTTVR